MLYHAPFCTLHFPRCIKSRLYSFPIFLSRLPSYFPRPPTQIKTRALGWLHLSPSPSPTLPPFRQDCGGSLGKHHVTCRLSKPARNSSDSFKLSYSSAVICYISVKGYYVWQVAFCVHSPQSE